MLDKITFHIFLFIFFTILIFIGNKLAFKFKFLDFPNERKKHNTPIPIFGGIYIYTILCLSVYLFNYSFFLNQIIVYSSLIVLMGFLDDFYDLSVSLRFVIIIFASYLLFDIGLQVNELGIYFGGMNLQLGSFAFIFTIISVVGLTNAFNFLDGTDGLLISQSIISLVLIILYSVISVGFLPYIDFFIVLIMTLITSLIFNLGFFKKNKFFLGDSGSMTLGFLFSFLLIYFTQVEIIFLHPSLAIWCVCLPLFDFFSTIFRRLKNNKNPFSGDNTHIQHLLKFFFKSHYSILLICITFSFLIGALGLIINYFLAPIFSISFFILFLIFYTWISCKLERHVESLK